MRFRRRRTIDAQGSIVRDTPTGIARKHELETNIPMGVELGAQWAWRLLVIAAALALIGFVVVLLRDIVIPLLIAMLVAALLVPLRNFLMRHRWPKWLAVLVALLVTFGVIGGLVTLVVFQVRGGLDNIVERGREQLTSVLQFLAAPPFNVDTSDLEKTITDAFTQLTSDTSSLVSGAVSVGSTAGHFLEGFFVVFFSTLFILIDGAGIFAWIVRVFPRRARKAVTGAGRAGWATLTTFVRVQIFVAFVDAVGIAIGAFIIGFWIPGGFPLVIPIAVIVFFASFIPVVGAIVSGVLAVLVALIFGGPIHAIAMLGVVLVVQQIEGHVLQPLVMGTAVKVHPLAVVLSVVAFSGAAGISGALFAVPLVATINVMVTYVASGRWRSDRTLEPSDTVTTADTGRH